MASKVQYGKYDILALSHFSVADSTYYNKNNKFSSVQKGQQVALIS